MQSSRGAALLAAAALAFASARAVASTVEINTAGDTRSVSTGPQAGQTAPQVGAASTGQGDVTPAPLPTALPAGLALIVGIAAYGKMKRREKHAI